MNRWPDRASSGWSGASQCRSQAEAGLARGGATTLPKDSTRGRSSLASTEPSERARELLEQLSAIFQAAKLRGVLIGGQAVNFWNEPRFTHDIDFTVAADAEAIKRVVSGMLAAGFTIRREQGKNAPSGHDFVQFVRPETQDIVEIQTAKTEFQDLVVNRGATIDATQPFPVATVEDLIVMKLIAGRSVDQHDILGLIRIPDIDWPYVEHWAAVWEVTDRLDALRDLVASERPGI